MNTAYHELPAAEYQAGLKILEAAADGDIPAYEQINPLQLSELEYLYAGWRSWHIERSGDTVLIDSVELLAWIEARSRDPGWDELRERGRRLRSIRNTPRCLIGSFRLALMRRAAAGEDVWIATGEKASSRNTYIVEDGKYQTLWEGSEEAWRAELCDPNGPDAWPLCKNICHRRGMDGY